jgi:hypothetical protein
LINLKKELLDYRGVVIPKGTRIKIVKKLKKHKTLDFRLIEIKIIDKNVKGVIFKKTILSDLDLKKSV